MDRKFSTAFYVHDVESLAANIRVIQEQPITVQFHLGKDEYFKYQTESKYRTVSAAIRADELARLFNHNRLNLFRLNPRYFLTTKSVVNREILETLNGENADDFYLYNNGVTATCNAISFLDVDVGSRLEVEDFQIVNGCQTTVTLHEMWKQAGGAEKLQTVRVPIRIIETPAAKQMAEQVARTTNRQNQMKQEDFRSGDKLRAKLHAEFDKASHKISLGDEVQFWNYGFILEDPANDLWFVASDILTFVQEPIFRLEFLQFEDEVGQIIDYYYAIWAEDTSGNHTLSDLTASARVVDSRFGNMLVYQDPSQYEVFKAFDPEENGAISIYVQEDVPLSLTEYAGARETGILDAGAEDLTKETVQTAQGLPAVLFEWTLHGEATFVLTYLSDDGVGVDIVYTFPADQFEAGRELAYYSFGTFLVN